MSTHRNPAERPPRDDAGRKTATYRRFLDPRAIEGGLDRLAVAQHGVFTLDQVVALGLSDRAVHHRSIKGALHRIHQGVYALTPIELLTGHGRRMAAAFACGSGAAVSHHSAGDLHGLIATRRSKIDVTVPTRGGRARAGIQIHRSSKLRPEDVTTVDGIPCTTVARTLFDLAGVLGQRRLERALDQAVSLEVLDMTAVTEQLSHNAGRNRAAAALRRVLGEHLLGSTPTWNEFEERFLAITRDIGLPDPEVQQWLFLGDGEPAIRAGFLWRDERVIVETDGWRDHRTRTSFEHDRRRDQRAAAAGYQTIRVTWRQTQTERARLQATLLAVVRERSARSAPAGRAAAGAATAAA